MAKATTVVRHIFQNWREANGRSRWGVFTNCYDTCRTVKVYGKAPQEVLDQIAKVAKLHGFTYTVRYHYSNRQPMPSTIVRIPLDQQELA